MATRGRSPQITVAGYAGKPGAMRPIYEVEDGKGCYRRDPKTGNWARQEYSRQEHPLVPKYERIADRKVLHQLETLVRLRKESGIDDSYKG